MSAERLETIIRNNPGAYLYDGGDGEWELVAAEQPGIVKPAVTLASSGDGYEPHAILAALSAIAGINHRI